MIGPVCSLYPGESGWRPDDAAGSGRRWYVTALGVLVAVAVLLAPVALAYHSQVERLRGLAGGSDPAAAPPAPGPPDGGVAPGGDVAPPPPLGPDGAPARWRGTTAMQDTFEHQGGLVLVRATHRGEGPFALTIDGEDAGATPGAAGGPLVDVPGAYQGSRALGLPAGTYRVAVAAGGEWGLTVERPAYAGAVRLPRVFEGGGDTATRPFRLDAAREVRMTWTVERAGSGAPAADDRLRVRVLDAYGGTVVDTVVRHGERIDQYLQPGRYILDVSTGAGRWRVLMS